MLCIKCNEVEGNKASGYCNGCEDKARGKIDGLLYLPALGLVLTLCRYVIDLWGISVQWLEMHQQMGIYRGFGLSILLLTMLGLIVTAVAAWFFFRHSKRTRMAMVGYYLFSLASACYLVFMPQHLFGLPLGRDAVSLLSASVVGVVLWTPYFLFSRRIPEVFNR